MEITIKEVEANKINLQKDDALFITFKGEVFMENYESVELLREKIQDMFPNNRIVVLVCPNDHSIDFTTINRNDLTEEESQGYPEQEENKCDGCDCCCSRDGKCGDSESEENKGE